MALTTEQNVYLHELHCKFTSGNISVPAAIEAFWNRFAPQQPSAERRETTMAPPGDYEQEKHAPQPAPFEDADGNKNWTGLLGYARAMNVIMTQEEAVQATEVYRKAYPEIPLMWKDLERAAKRAIKNPGGEFSVGSVGTRARRSWPRSRKRHPNERQV